MLFKLIKNSYPPASSISPKNHSISDPFRMPIQTRERINNKKSRDIYFQGLIDRESESKTQSFRPTPDPGDWRKTNFEQVHYVRKLKARMIWKSRPVSGKGDAALLISQKKINPMIQYRNQRLGYK